MTANTCLSHQELTDYLQGNVELSRVEMIAVHVENCRDCQGTVVRLAEQSDTLIAALRGADAGDPFADEIACRAAVGQIASVAGNPSGKDDNGSLQRIGPYQVIERLGSGGMGTVFKALHTKLKRTVALKILPASRWASAAAVSRFEREMEAIGQLDHPHIVRASDAGEEFGMHYLVMEYVDGLDLSRIARRLETLGVEDVCEIGRQVALGLQYADENRLVHRDIKPSNLILAAAERSFGTQTVTVKILDLGLALLGDEHAERDNLTTVGQLMGTLDYMSPEQGLDCHDVDIRADIYSLGATLFKLLTGRAPFAGPEHNTLLKKLTALANKPAPPIQSLRSGIPDELAAVIDRMLSHDPDERFATPSEVAEAMAPWAKGANLASLLEMARKSPERESEIVAPKLVSTPFTFAAPSAKPSFPASGRRLRVLLGILAGLLFILLAGGTIRLITDRGELIVDAVDPNVNVVIKRDGRVVKQMELEQGENRITIRSGEYQIELDGQGSDRLVLSNHMLSVLRGKQTIVRVMERLRVADAGSSMGMAGSMGMGGSGEAMGTSGYGGMDSGSAASGMMPMGGMSMPGMAMGAPSGGAFGMYGSSGPGMAPLDPTYDRKTYTQWLAELETERKPERLEEAVRAFADLGEGELASKSVAAILQIMRRYGSSIIDDSARGRLLAQALNALQQLPANVVVPSTIDELGRGNSRSRNFIVNQLLFTGLYARDTPLGSHAAELQHELKRHRDALFSALMAVPDDETPEVRAGTFRDLITYHEILGLRPGQVEQLLEKLQVAVLQRDPLLTEVVTSGLVKLDPDNVNLVPALIRQLNVTYYNYRLDAVKRLGELGERSAPAVESLVKIIQQLVSPSRAANAGAMPGGFPGGFMMGSGGMPGAFGGYAPGQDLIAESIVALGKIGPKAKAALPVLQRLVEMRHAQMTGQDPVGVDPSYAALASEAIAKIEERPDSPKK